MGLLAKRVIINVVSITCRNLSTKIKPSASLQEETTNDIILKYLDGKDNGIAVLGLNKLKSRNAFSKNLVNQFNETLNLINADKKIRVLIIKSLIPNVFCAGADLRERIKMEPNEAGNFVDSLRNLMNDIEKLPTPVISAIDGAALGGGLEMALASDIRIASIEAKIGLVETKLAIIPGAGGTQRLPRIVGSAMAKELIYTGRIIDGNEAYRIGLVNRVVPQNKNGDAAYQESLNVAREILPNGPIGVRLAKVAITKGMETSMADGFEIEKECYSQLLNTEDRVEGLAAFVSKRVPVYRGL